MAKARKKSKLLASLYSFIRKLLAELFMPNSSIDLLRDPFQVSSFKLHDNLMQCG